MATKKRAKAKTKAKTKKKSVKSRAAPARARKKKPAAKAKPKARAVKPKAAVRAKPPASMPRPAIPPAAPPPAAVVGGERVGIVTHYFSHLSVAIIRMERGSLREGDTVHIKGHTSDFRQRVESMEIDHVHVAQVGAKQEFGMRVIDHVREHDVVYKVASP